MFAAEVEFLTGNLWQLIINNRELNSENFWKFHFFINVQMNEIKKKILTFLCGIPSNGENIKFHRTKK